MKCLLILVLSLFLSVLACGQDQRLLQGVVTDGNSKLALPYCNLWLKHAGVGVTGNELGEYMLHYPEGLEKDTLVVSYIGFETVEKPASQLLQTTELDFQLIRKNLTLQNVVIGPVLSADAMISKVVGALPANLNTDASALHGFFRGYVKSDSKYDKLMEGDIRLSTTGFNWKRNVWNRYEIELNEARASQINGRVADVKKANNLDNIIDLYEFSFYNLLVNPHCKMSYAIDTTEWLGVDRIVKISFKHEDEENGLVRYGTLRINTSDWAILEMEYSMKLTKKLDKQILKENDSVRFRQTAEHYFIKNTRFEGKYYLGYIKYSLVNQIMQPASDFDFFVTMEYATNQISTTSKTKIHSGTPLDRKQNLYAQVTSKPYHPEFWKTCNLILETPELEQIRKDINAQGDINGQFEKPSRNGK